jgi:hypothetical protein
MAAGHVFAGFWQNCGRLLYFATQNFALNALQFCCKKSFERVTLMANLRRQLRVQSGARPDEV